ncbi:hypothetical protein VTN77DRAFT_9883 [Rasamsonia byssochlamydoides]|uniref:uncharacterized protein n=1 Tax=Rasamsonia byssochlamydoides TaxID=89139 RepID=UPI0037446085
MGSVLGDATLQSPYQSWRSYLSDIVQLAERETAGAVEDSRTFAMGALSIVTAVLALLAPASLAASSSAIVSSPGDTAVIPGWNMQSTLYASTNLTALSQPGADVSSWYRVSLRTTAMAGLIEAGVYNDTQLFYSDNLNTVVDRSVFNTPWLYREEFTVNLTSGQHFFLVTHGITSKADIYINGAVIATSDYQEGSYGGHKYEITKYLQSGPNCLLIQAYPTNYLADFAMGFVDWNPYPPDNGTGVWRDVEISQTGPVALAPLRVVTDYTPGATKVAITVKTNITNNEANPVSGTVQGLIRSDDGSQTLPLSQSFSLQPQEEKTIAITVQLENPKIWWPALWGEQPLYAVSLNASVSGAVSDVASPRNFGIRHITSHLNSYNDTAFTVNGLPFLVLGGGYSPDMFMRWDEDRAQKQFQYMLDMGLNTVRLEGKQEHPELFDLADRMGLMIMPGWECCDKWEGWTYNDAADGVKWDDHDYWIANYSMLHEASMMQTHPSVLAFLVGSDYWPDDRAAQIYVDALRTWDWPNPIIASAGELGYPQILGLSGMKMVGPYDWVPPNYWYGGQEGAAFGFGSELGAGVGTPEIRSLRKFLSESDLNDLWTKPKNGLFHMSSNVSQFYDRSIYDAALFARYGKPTSLDDYLLKAQIMDYEATRAEFEGVSALQNAERPATGTIYWMMNGAWPNLHWQLFDYYLSPAGSYFGTKVGARPEHVAYNYEEHAVYLINHYNALAGNDNGARTVSIELIDPTGKALSRQNITTQTKPNSSKRLVTVSGINKIKDVAFLKLVLQDSSNAVLSRNVYWLSSKNDTLKWKATTWYYTPVTSYADYTALNKLANATVTASVQPGQSNKEGTSSLSVVLENKSDVPAFFIRLVLTDEGTDDAIAPVYWSDNYVTLFPRESLTLTVEYPSGSSSPAIEISGRNIPTSLVK